MKAKKYTIIILILLFILIPGKVFANYVGSVNSNIYHYTYCEWARKIYSQNAIYFSSVSDAQNHGYRACKVCCPPQSDPVSTKVNYNDTYSSYPIETSSDDSSGGLATVGLLGAGAAVGYGISKAKKS